MTQPVLDPPDELFRAPLRDEVFDDGVLTETEERQAQRIQQQAEEGNNLEVVALALGASFLLYRRYMRRRLMEQVQPSWTADALLTAAAMAWVTFVPRWLRLVAPIIALAYWQGTREARRGEVSPELVDRAANEYARSMGDYIHQISSHALLEGFNAYLNRKATRKVAAEKSINAFGLTARPMRSVVAAEKLTEQAVSTVEARELDTKMERHIRHLLLGRAKTIGDNEAFAAAKQAKQLVWMWQSGHGKLPKEAYKEWITARDERVCEYCGPMHGATADVNEPFKTEIGEVWMPSLHPSCRCDVTLRVPTKSLLSKAWESREHPRGAKGRFVDKPDEAKPGVALDPNTARLLRETMLRSIPEAVEEERLGTPEELGRLAPVERLGSLGPAKSSSSSSQKETLGSPAMKGERLGDGQLGFTERLGAQGRLGSADLMLVLQQAVRQAKHKESRREPAKNTVSLDRPIFLAGEQGYQHSRNEWRLGSIRNFYDHAVHDDPEVVWKQVDREWDKAYDEALDDFYREKNAYISVRDEGTVVRVPLTEEMVHTAFAAMARGDTDNFIEDLEGVDAEGNLHALPRLSADELRKRMGYDREDYIPIIYQLSEIHMDDDYTPARRTWGNMVSHNDYEVLTVETHYTEKGLPYRLVTATPVEEESD